MQAILTRNLFRRPQPTNEIAAQGFLDKNSVIEIVETVSGKRIDGIATWHKAADGFFYWGGGIEQIREARALATATVSIDKSTQWFQDLKIDSLWSLLNDRGDNVTIAVLDTGYDTGNPDLPVPIGTKLFVNNPTNTATIQDKLWHGTFCTSVIASRNKTINIGIAPQCKVLIGKVSLKGELKDISLILDGIEWAIQSGAEVISISLGIPLDDAQQVTDLQRRLDQILHGKNVLIFAACGDAFSGEVISREIYPASFDNVISVGTVKDERLDNITIRSDRTILHTLGIDVEAYVLDGLIEKRSGTSMSVPIIAAIMSLAISFVKKRDGGQWNKNDLLMKMINTAKPIPAIAKKKIMDPVKFFQSL